LWKLWAIVKRLGAARLIGFTNILYFLSDDWALDPRRDSVKFDKPADFRQWLSILEEYCIDLGLKASVSTIYKMQDLFSKPEPITYGEARPLAQELQSRLIDEMKETVVLFLSSSEAEHYKNNQKGWELIIDHFPDVINDIEEARKCFALSRYPATVFHSLQIVEFGLLKLGKFISVEDPKSGWTAVANKLKKIISKKHEDRTEFEKQNFEFIEQVQGTIEALKNAWRNKISHAEGKLILMTKDFSPEIAEEILFATRAFMRRLASGLPR
jgi:HEPN domain-containing protein